MFTFLKSPHCVQLSRSTTDALKVVSAILVIIGHMASICITNYSSSNPVFYVLASQSGYLAVAIFFFLSGYGLMMSEVKNHLGFNTFVKRRFLKVYLPVLFVTLLWLPVFRALEIGG